MTRFGFYHLTRTGPDQVLPGLLGRTLDAGERAVVLCGGPERVAALDAALWLCAAPDWLPHGSAAGGQLAAGWAARQPIWLTDSEAAPNGARYLFLIDGRRAARPQDFTRVFDLFDGNDPTAVVAARQRWRDARATGQAVDYWRQGGSGWERG